MAQQETDPVVGAERPGVERSVTPRALMPLLLLTRALRLATTMPILLLALVGALIMPSGWWSAEWLLTEDDGSPEMQRIVEANHAWPSEAEPQPGAPPWKLRQAWMPQSWNEWVAPVTQPVTRLMRPVAHLFSFQTTFSQGAYLLVGTLWNLLVWALFGGAITRMAVMKLGRQEREGMFAAIRFAARRYTSLAGAPLFPLFGVLIAVIGATLIGLLMRFDVGMLLAALLWILVLISGLVVTVILGGLAFGWPLMWGAICSEEMGDVFEASQRCYGYTFGRPLHYLFYVVVACVMGAFGFLCVHWFAQAVLYFSYWNVSWGAGSDSLRRLAPMGGGTGSAAVESASFLIQFFHAMVMAMAGAFRYGFFWCATGAIYLLMRQANDRTEFDDVYVGGHRVEGQLPELTTDADGVPGVAEQSS